MQDFALGSCVQIANNYTSVVLSDGGPPQWLSVWVVLEGIEADEGWEGIGRPEFMLLTGGEETDKLFVDCSQGGDL